MLNIECGGVKNIGRGSCPFTPGISTMGILAPVTNAIVTEANMADSATLLAFINAQLHHDDPLKRWHILGPYRGIDNMSQDITTFDDEYGDKEVTDDVRYAYGFRLKNGIAHHKFLRTFNKQHEKFVYFDFSGDVMMGATHPEKDADGNDQMTGFDLNLIFAPGATKADRANPTFFKVILGLADTVQVNDDYYHVELGFNPLRALKGVQEVILKDVTPAGTAAGTFHIQATTEDGKVNLASGTLGSVLAAVDAWISKDKPTSAEIDIDSVSRNAANTAFIIALDTTDLDYDNGPGVARIDLESVGDLETLGAKWYANSASAEVATA